jgi:hypothetical protein
MSISTVAHPRPGLSRRLDQACVALLRAVMADSWSPENAAHDLLHRVDDDRRLLKLLRARVSRVMLDRPTRIAERATITLDHALSTTPVNQPADLFPSQRRGWSA